jgi:hypothetical protein
MSNELELLLAAMSYDSYIQSRENTITLEGW